MPNLRLGSCLTLSDFSIIAYINTLIEQLNIEFCIKNLGSLNYFLGIEVTRGSTALDLLKHPNLLMLNRFSFLLLIVNVSAKMIVFFFLILLNIDYGGNLQYLTTTHLDISFALNQVCKLMYCHAPKSDYIGLRCKSLIMTKFWYIKYFIN